MAHVTYKKPSSELLLIVRRLIGVNLLSFLTLILLLYFPFISLLFSFFIYSGVETNASYARTVVGVNNLIEENYPQIAAVGMAAAEGREPRIVDIRWDAPMGDKNSENSSTSASGNSSQNIPEIVIIGKGITFDTGGLNIKGGGGMRNMKRDMAGAAQALSLALWIVESKFPVKLRLLLPIAENSISGIALRPGKLCGL